MRSYIVLAVLVCAAGTSDIESGDCNIQECKAKIKNSGSSEQICLSYQVALACGKYTIFDNEKCSLALIVEAHVDFSTIHDEVAKCNSTSSSQCDLQTCTSKLVEVGNQAAKCKGYNDYDKCQKGIIYINSTCSEDVKEAAQIILNYNQKKIDECNGVAELVSSLVLCLVTNIMAYFLTSRK